jgi:hypothetical protein
MCIVTESMDYMIWQRVGEDCLIFRSRLEACTDDDGWLMQVEYTKGKLTLSQIPHTQLLLPPQHHLQASPLLKTLTLD